MVIGSSFAGGFAKHPPGGVVPGKHGEKAFSLLPIRLIREQVTRHLPEANYLKYSLFLPLCRVYPKNQDGTGKRPMKRSGAEIYRF
jgi:hypothetical protein